MPRATIAILFHRLGPYHVARLQAAARLLPIVAVESSGVDATYAWDVVVGTNDFDRVTLFEQADAQERPATEVVSRVGLALDKIHPAVVVVPGWADVAALGALRWCVRNQIPAIVMSDSTAWDLRRIYWKEWVKRRIVGLASAALVGGHPHADYMAQLGMRKDRSFLGYDAVDNAYFAAEAAKWRGQRTEDRGQGSGVRGQRAEVPSSLRFAGTSGEPEGTGFASTIHNRSEAEMASSNPRSTIPISPYFLASNRFIEKKNLFRLLEAYAGYLKSFQFSVSSFQQRNNGANPADAGNGTPWDLCLLGDGELKPQLLAHCEKLGLHAIESTPWETVPPTANRQPPTVFFPGFRQYDELPRFYAHAGAFVHGSTTEQWGLVVNEAMASGLPVIVSNRCGCARDLVQDGVNGFTFDPYDVDQLARAMLRISAFNCPLSDFGAASARIIGDWGPERFVSGLKAAVENALQVGPQPASFLGQILLELLIGR